MPSDDDKGHSDLRLAIALLVGILVGILFMQIGITSSPSGEPTAANVYSYSGPWQQTGPTRVVDAYPFGVVLKDQQNRVVELNLCVGSPNQSIERGEVIDLRFRHTNPFSTIYAPCVEIESYTLLKPAKEQ